MDQSDFRALLATPGASSSKPKTKFGAAPPKRSAATVAESSTKPEFKPRVNKDKSKFKKKAAAAGDEGAYRDRAAERRTGGKGDFADAEKLLEDFKARAEGAEVDKTVLEDQMRYLGGDAEHSVLVKGLDMALLERMKYQQASVSDKTLEEVEDELDMALLEKASGKAAKGKGKRTRDEMIAEMKAGRGAATAGEEEGEGEGKGKDGKFKPAKRDGWKAVGAAPPPAAEGEKKLRKKKKKVKLDESTAAPPPPPPAADVKPQALPLLQPMVDMDDDEFDIFGGAGDYKGLDTDSESDDEGKVKEEAPPPPPPAAAAGAAKRSYFDEEEEDESITTAPSAVTNLASTAAAAEGSAATGEKRRREVGSDGEEEEEDGPTMKLQPLSGSRLSARELLELDDAAAKEEKRKEKKAHFMMKAADKKEATLKAMSAEERAAHDHQIMMSYLEKKEKRAKGGKEDDDDDDGQPEF